MKRQSILKPGFIIACLLATPAHAHAQSQSLPDPTRPPAQFTVPAAGKTAPVTAAPRLQSILISRAPGGRRLAVIDGQTVAQGGQFRGATVAHIGPNDVELVKEGSRQLLRLYPPAQPSSVK